jgi:hypothetical protein
MLDSRSARLIVVEILGGDQCSAVGPVWLMMMILVTNMAFSVFLYIRNACAPAEGVLIN